MRVAGESRSANEFERKFFPSTFERKREEKLRDPDTFGRSLAEEFLANLAKDLSSVPDLRGSRSGCGGVSGSAG
jgi:hypothetical protein